MLKFLGVIFIFILSAILFFGIFLGRVLRSFGANKSRRYDGKQNQGNEQSPSSKKFSKGEGEYVSYEEIKDEE